MGLAGLAWVAPGLMLFAARSGGAFRLGCLAAFTHYLVSLVWLLNVPVRFFPILGWIALAAYLALYPAAWAWLCCRLMPRGESTWLSRAGHALFCAAAWVAMEMILARMLTGFPWNLLGVSQGSLLPLIQVSAWTGVYGVSFVVAWFSASLLNAGLVAMRFPAARSLWMKELFPSLLVISIIFALGWREIRHEPASERTLRVALVQPSIPQTMIWNAADSETRFAELLKLTVAAMTHQPELVVWPEAAVPKMIRDDEDTLRAIAALAYTNQVTLIIGSDDVEFRGTNAHYFNSSFLVSPQGRLAATYRKRRLVIFGEYVPLADALPFIKYLTPISGGFTRGEGPVTFDLQAVGAKTSVLICFEDAFPHLAREHAAADLDFLVNLTNDGWFGDSAAQWQHVANAAFRAVENGMPLVRCANNGVTCWVDRHGAVRDVGFNDRRDVYRAGFKVVEIPLGRRSAPTFYNRHGDWFGWACVGFVLAVVVARWGAVRRPERGHSVGGNLFQE